MAPERGASEQPDYTKIESSSSCSVMMMILFLSLCLGLFFFGRERVVATKIGVLFMLCSCVTQ